MKGLDAIYEDGKVYQAEVMDLFNPEASEVVIGINGWVNTFFARRPIEITGMQIKGLLSVTEPVPILKEQNGINRVVGYKDRRRFAVTLLGSEIGSFPVGDSINLRPEAAARIVEDVRLLQPGIPEPDQSVRLQSKAEVPDGNSAVEEGDFDPEVMAEPIADDAVSTVRTKESLLAMKREELAGMAQGYGLRVGKDDNKGMIADLILAYEEKM
ncbi:MAG: hypothetical protein LUC51_02465 [Cloacibacillus porcorum]|nr:hypothetical protein [Cloacibacillus porcorum]